MREWRGGPRGNVMRGGFSSILLGLLATLVTLLALLLLSLAYVTSRFDNAESWPAVFLAVGLGIGGAALFVWLALARRLRAQRDTGGHRAARRRAQRVRR